MLPSGSHTFALAATTSAMVAMRNGVTSLEVMLVNPKTMPSISMTSMIQPSIAKPSQLPSFHAM